MGEQQQYACSILADSVSQHGNRLTTYLLTYPRMVHAELMTHRMFSRNSASSRAIPVERMIDNVINFPVMPVYWGKNQAGMQASQELSESEQHDAKREWMMARHSAIEHAQKLIAIGAHKQIVNRLLEPWMWITVIVSATDFANFFHLRCHPAAQPEIRYIADWMRDLYFTNIPDVLAPNEYHMPLIYPDDRHDFDHGLIEYNDLIKICVGRVARVSYLTHEGLRDRKADIALHDRLLESGHWSPFEHAATPGDDDVYYGNFRGWFQYRKSFHNENWMELDHPARVEQIDLPNMR